MVQPATFQVNGDLYHKICEQCDARPEGEGHSGKCPAHDDRTPSLGLIRFPSGVIYVKCHAGCAPAALAKALGVARYKEGTDGGLSIPPPSAGEARETHLTLEGLARHVGVPPSVFERFTVKEHGGVIHIPYWQWDGEQARKRLRLSLTGDKHRWAKAKGQKAKPIVPYCLWKVREYKNRRRKEEKPLVALWIVEGESDCWSLWHHGYPALGIPGATCGKAIQRIEAEHLAGFEEVIIWQEPDQAGGTMAAKVLARVEEVYKGKITVVTQRLWKDPCEALKSGRTSLKVCYDAGACTPKQFRAAPAVNTPLAAGQAFAREYSRQRFAHNDALGGWLAWDGCRLVRGRDHAIRLCAQDYWQHLWDNAVAVKNAETREGQKKFLRGLATPEKLAGLVKVAEPILHVNEQELDANPLHVNLANGWYDLFNHEFHRHGKPAPFTRVAGTHYDAEAACPFWDLCVADYWDDPEVRRYFRQQCGLLLGGQTYKHMLYMFGVGDNGKSMLAELLRAVLGDYAASIDVDDLLLKTNDRVPYSLADLRGVRLVTTSELPDGGRLNEGLVKRITGGNTIQARQIYGRPFEYVPQFKLWFDGNFKPQLSTDQATWGRFHLLPFTKQFARDNSLLGRLKAEAAGIFNWMLAGWKDYQENDLFYPAALAEQKEEFRAECDDYGTFVTTFFEAAQGARVNRDDAYAAFKTWWRQQRPSGPIPNMRTFAREARRIGVKEEKSHGNYYWLDLLPSEAYHDLRDRFPGFWPGDPHGG
jgi:putative DNA primase/helicase